MHKIFVASLMLLALAIFASAPAVAAEVAAEVQLELTQDEPHMTPSEVSEPVDLPELLDPSGGLLVEKIEACSGPHPACPPGCECAAITVTRVYCTCP